MTGGRVASLVLVAVLLAATGAGCDSGQQAITRDDLPDVPDEPTVTVEIDGSGFEPPEIEVTTEDLVEFVNTGDEDHGVRTDDSSIHTGLIFPGESTLVMFDEPGTYDLFDIADDTRTMTVVSTEAPD